LGFSNVCTLPTITPAPGLDWPSVDESWSGMVAGFGSTQSLDKDPHSDSHSLREKTGGKPKHVLVVEDNESDVFLIREALQATGMSLSVHLAKDGEQAVHFFDRAEASTDAPCPALVLLDINLPKLPGGEVLKYLRQLSRCAATRVLVVSTSDSYYDRENMMKLGANGYFRKPSRYEEFMKLSDVVKVLLNNPLPDD